MLFSPKMRNGAIAAVVLAASLAVAPLHAQEQDVTPSHLAAARAAVEAIGATEPFDNILLNAATQTKSELIINNPNLQTEISDMVDKEALALAPRRADLENEIARIYAKLFTEEELKQISDFYTSEAGQKLIKLGPVATNEMMSSADVWTKGILRDLHDKAAAGMKALAPQAPAAGATPTK